jgi:hypothetical protein
MEVKKYVKGGKTKKKKGQAQEGEKNTLLSAKEELILKRKEEARRKAEEESQSPKKSAQRTGRPVGKRLGAAQSDTLERSPEQVRENARAASLLEKSYPKQGREKTYEEKLKEAAERRSSNARRNAANAKRPVLRPGVPAPPLDDQNLRNRDGSPLRGGPKATPIAPKKITTKTPKKTLKKSKAVIPVPPTKGRGRRNRK